MRGKQPDYRGTALEPRDRIGRESAHREYHVGLAEQRLGTEFRALVGRIGKARRLAGIGLDRHPQTQLQVLRDQRGRKRHSSLVADPFAGHK